MLMALKQTTKHHSQKELNHHEAFSVTLSSTPRPMACHEGAPESTHQLGTDLVHQPTHF